MIESVRIQNFRCLRDVTLELGPFTVFVGPNASGKSAIADALTYSRQDLLIPGENFIGNLDDPRYSEEKYRDILQKSHFWQGKERPIWEKDDKTSHDPAKILTGQRCKYSFLLSTLRALHEANEEWQLDSTGSNLANVFDTLSRKDQERYVDTFTHLVPMYSDVKVRAKEGSTRLQFLDRWQEDFWYEPDQVSDGTMLTAALVSLSFQKESPMLAVIEDPDHGLHPYLQRHVVEMLKKLSKGELGSQPIQIICTTHSQSFLNCLKPEEVRFIRRSRETGETEIQKAPIDNPNWQKVYDQFQNSLGGMWMTGTLGGVPGI
ncbi:AAA family ATPase [Leptothoe kymatousa]|uniref:AAA family ATPase n=1 Tax=Leptothoe kymatousa TAU-MAC 1615 TaxID=2364775 RepID=A0ABS5Y7B9_9CYAN|nr:AAA family ATPase [Leptothoe kymatousa]MBT9313718.1 AAA family ATPase [Leptothoe kymatousa TAU-MAC 1615]